VAVTPATFKEEYDEFDDRADAKVQAKINEAYLRIGEAWGDLRDVAVKKLTAHLLAMSPLSELSARAPTAAGGDNWAKTTYGRELIELQDGARVRFFGTTSGGS
jgi:hypothetical protein